MSRNRKADSKQAEETQLAEHLKRGFVVCITDDHPVEWKGELRMAKTNDMFVVAKIEFKDEKTLVGTAHDGRLFMVNPNKVTIRCGQRQPDVELRLFLVGHGYQADVYQDQQMATSHCRDFGGTHPIAKLSSRAVRMTESWLDAYRKGL